MDEEDYRQPLTVVEPGVAYCRCGRRMQVKPSRFHQRLGQPGGEDMRRLLRECDCDHRRIKAALSVYDVFESWIMAYTCPSCRVFYEDGSAQYTEEEAREVATNSSAA